MLIYKVFRRDEYQRFLQDGQSAGAPVDLTDGYIHFSTADQIATTLAKHFAGEDGLVLLAVETEELDGLRWEPSRGGALFPHLYRSLHADDIQWVRPLTLGPSGHVTGELE